MRQILNHLRTGEISVADVPAPGVESGHLLIRTQTTLVSQGTERMLVEFGRANLWQKARAQPERVRQVLQKIRSDGLLSTVEAVFRRLDEPLPLGYCNAGEVVGVGDGVKGYAVGDRVASNGPHAEIVSVPANLCAKVPANVSDDEAAFTVAGAIALQGVRLLNPALGETIAVIGLGLMGQITVQLLRSNGCRVVGYDFDPAKVELARRSGADCLAVGGEEVGPVRHALLATGGLGVDGVVIAASTDSDDVIAQAAHMCRKRGRIVLVGVVGMKLNRADFYEKELTFQVSCSYGPGRYEDAYEEKGYDYPPAFVRWTESRNFQAVLDAMGSGRLDMKPLISRRVPLERFREIYDDFNSAEIASLLTYGPEPVAARTTMLTPRRFEPGAGVLAVVGTGNFTKMTLLPALVAARAPVKYLVSASGVSSTHLAGKYGIPNSTTDFEEVLADAEVRGVIIATRHNLHARQAIRALRANRHVLVEKPLCLALGELGEVEEALAAGRATLSVGFNRRFSPHAQKIRELLGATPAPLSLVATMNAGAVPLSSWVHDPETGGGRLIGEACHWIDLAVYFAGSPVTAVCAAALGGAAAPAQDTASILMRHASGSTAVINFLANGHREYPKERCEIFSQGRVLVLDDFRELTGFGFKRFSRLRTRSDKGHAAQFSDFARRVREGGAPLIPWTELANVARATLAVGESLRSNGWVMIPTA